MLGVPVRGLGLKVAVADFAVRTPMPRRSLGDFWRQELRWARTIRSLDPAGYFGTIVTHPLGWGFLDMAFGGFTFGAALLFLVAICAV